MRCSSNSNLNCCISMVSGDIMGMNKRCKRERESGQGGQSRMQTE